MGRTIVLALLLGFVPASGAEAKGFYSIAEYRTWNVDYRVGYVVGMLETAFLMTKELYPEAHELSRPCFEKKGIFAWATEVDDLMMHYNPSAKFDARNMSLPEYVQWAFGHLCSQK